MIINAVILLILCIFAFIPLLLGEFAGRKSVDTTEDFILQGRKMKLFPMYATIFATWMSIFAFIGGITYFYEEGPIFMTTVGWDALFAVLFIFVGRRLWHYGKKYKYMTPVDFFSDIYDSKALNVIVTIVTIVCTMVYLQVQIVGGLLVMRVATDGIISWYIGGIIFFSILVIYLWAGGLRAVAMTDIFYGILIVLSILSSGFFLMHVAGGSEAVFSELVQREPANVSMMGPEGNHRILLWLSLFVIVPVGAFMGPQMWIRNYSAGSAKHFEVLPLLLCISSIVCVGTMMAGSAGVVLAENVENPDYILVDLMSKYANPFFYIFVIIGVYATIFSTANSQVHALAAVYTIDVYRKYMKKNVPDKKLVSVAKWAVHCYFHDILSSDRPYAAEYIRSGDDSSRRNGAANSSCARCVLLEPFNGLCRYSRDFCGRDSFRNSSVFEQLRRCKHLRHGRACGKSVFLYCRDNCGQTENQSI